MEINYFIRVYDNILKLPSLSSFIKLANQIQFEDAMIGGKGTVDKKIRSTKIEFDRFDFLSKNQRLSSMSRISRLLLIRRHNLLTPP